MEIKEERERVKIGKGNKENKIGREEENYTTK